MPYNLIHQKWIPVKRKSGEHVKIAPWQLTDGLNSNPIIGLDAPRPDFNGSLIQFLIGLAQTTIAPEDVDKWFDLYDKPPEKKRLKDAFTKVESAFNLDDNGPCFLQEPDLETGVPKNISLLLIDSPADNTLKNNKDHFVKRGRYSHLCFDCAAAALFTLQTNAPSGGVGHRTSLRGGGPLTTLLYTENLWHTIWLNTLDMILFNINHSIDIASDILDPFPWLLSKRTGEDRTGCDTTPDDVHPLHMYWGMPRRIKLNFKETRQGTCDLCGEEDITVINQYFTKNYGINYTGAWKHPLSPYRKDDKGFPLAVHPQPGGITYRHWLGLVQHDSEGKNPVEPALVVHRYLTELARDIPDYRLWAFGYDMDNMKARCWYESIMPLIWIEKKHKTRYTEIISGYIKAAVEIAGNLKMSLKKAWFKKPGDVKGDTSYIDTAFWQNTGRDFYLSIRDLKVALKGDEEPEKIAENWHRILLRGALKLFDEYVLTENMEDSDPGRIAKARRDLIRYSHTKKIKEELLFLPKSNKT